MKSKTLILALNLTLVSARHCAFARARRLSSTPAIAGVPVAAVSRSCGRMAFPRSAIASLVVISFLAAGGTRAQVLDPTFPTVGSSVSNTAAAFLDLGTADVDTGALLVPRSVGSGLSMVFTATENTGFDTFYNIGLRRMIRTGAPNFGAMLSKVVALPITSWTYKSSDEGTHVGPIAEDFKAAFGLAGDGKSISTVDADGVALAAIQGLNQKLEAENAVLKARLDAIEAKLK